MNVFFEKIFKSFPDRQNFKIFPQRAYKHLQNIKKYVIINKLISITIKNGLMVKRLRRCPLTAESAVRFRMGLPKKYSTTLCGAVFFCLPLSGTTRQLVAVVRICVSKFCRSSPFYGSRENPKGHANGNGNFRMGLHTSSVCETTRQLVCRRSSICASKFLPRNSVLRRSKVSEKACKRKRQLPHGATYFFGA